MFSAWARRIAACLGPNWAAQSLFRGLLRGLRQLRLTRATVAAVPRVDARPRGGALGARAKQAGQAPNMTSAAFSHQKGGRRMRRKCPAGERQRVSYDGICDFTTPRLYARARRFSPTPVYL